jgi:hypothetical protein
MRYETKLFLKLIISFLRLLMVIGTLLNNLIPVNIMPFWETDLNCADRVDFYFQYSGHGLQVILIIYDKQH